MEKIKKGFRKKKEDKKIRNKKVKLKIDYKKMKTNYYRRNYRIENAKSEKKEEIVIE